VSPRSSLERFLAEPDGIPNRDLWWSLVADRVEVHQIPGAHLTSITAQGREEAEHVRACLASARADRA